MSKIRFVFERSKFEMILEGNDTIEVVLKKYAKLLSKNINDLIFLYKGKNILLYDNIKNRKKIKNKTYIQVFRKTKKKYNNDELENIICPECKDLTFININGDNININGCINKHKKAYTINEFMKMQYIDEKEIKCDRCKNNKYLYNDNFYICSCKLKFCQLCFYKHKKKEGHNLIYFNKRYSICKKHISEFISYCTICNRNLCEKCEEEDINHKNNIIIFKKEKPNDKNIKEKKKGDN